MFLFVCSGTQGIISIKGFGITTCDQLQHRNTIFAFKKSYPEPFLFCKRNDKSLNQDNDLNKNCVSNSTLNPPNLYPKFPSLPKMSGFKIAFLNICSLTCHYDELCVFTGDRTIKILGLNETRLDNSISEYYYG